MQVTNKFGRAFFTTIAIGLVLPLAILTCNGWLGLAVHWLALSGAASLLTGSSHEGSLRFDRVEALKGETSCAAVKSKAS
jgi:hypothetical protein